MRMKDENDVGAQGATEDVAACPLVPTSSASHAVCMCGNGWTFDFVSKRVYCRECEAAEQTND